jgi:DNA-binding HxlR family transcriptional regulator
MLTINRLYIMLAIELLGDRSRGMVVSGFLMANTETMNRPSLKTGVYVMLHRMVELGLVDKLRAGDESPFPYYRLTTRGRKTLWATLDELAQLGKMAKRALKKVK